MYLHLGKNVIARQADIIIVGDLDNASYSHLTREYLARAEKSGEVVNVSDEIPKSFIVCENGGENRLYLSQLSPATLLKRAETGSFLTEQ